MNLDSSVIRTYLQLQAGHFSDYLSAEQSYAEQPLLSTSLTRVAAAPLISIRTAAIAAGIATDYYSLIGLQRGSGYWISEQRQTPLQAGDLIFIHASESFTFHFDRHYEVVSFNLPRWVVDDVPPHGTVWPGTGDSDGTAHDLVSLMASRYRQMQQGDFRYRQNTEARLLRAVAVMAAQQTPKQDSLQLVQQLIRQHAADEALNTDWLGRRSGFSRRYLFKLFSQQPCSLNQFIFRTRLEHAYLGLTDPQALIRPVNDIALSSGFKSQAHFSRLFRQHFSVAPGAIRRQLKDTIGRDIIHYG